jgi:hypothetical protein
MTVRTIRRFPGAFPVRYLRSRSPKYYPKQSVDGSTAAWRVNAVVALSIGVIKAAIVAAVFMELRHRGPPTFIFAGAGLFWLGILLWLGLMDFLSRT